MVPLLLRPVRPIIQQRRWVNGHVTTLIVSGVSVCRDRKYGSVVDRSFHSPKRHATTPVSPLIPTTTAKPFHSSCRTNSSGINGPTTTTTTLNVHLYQYGICPFCNSVKTLLEYARVDYQATEVNPLTKAEIKQWKSTYSKVPIATTTTLVTTTRQHHSQDEQDEQTHATTITPLFGSDTILQAMLNEPVVQRNLLERWGVSSTTTLSSPTVSPLTMTLDDFSSAPSVKHWQDFAVNQLAVVLYPNMCRTLRDSLQAFDYVHRPPTTRVLNSFGPLERFGIQYLGALAMYIASSRIKSTLKTNSPLMLALCDNETLTNAFWVSNHHYRRRRHVLPAHRARAEKRNIASERDALDALLVQLEQVLVTHRYLSQHPSQQPNLGDLIVFGTLRSIHGLPVHTELILNRGGPVRDWYTDLLQQVDVESTLEK